MKGVPFSALVNGRVGISQVEGYERVGKSIISIFKNAQKAQQMHNVFMAYVLFLRCIHILKMVHLQQLH